jgi:HPt (histidine-containing phosphotransfer) domain-containing protein
MELSVRMSEETIPIPQIQSVYADDPDLRDIVAMFVEEMPERVAAVEMAFRAGDLDTLTRLAHQLRGSAGGYGFTSIGDAAAEIEETILEGGASPAALARAVAFFRLMAAAMECPAGLENSAP